MKQKAIIAGGVLFFLILTGSSLGGIDIVTNLKSCLVVLGGTLLCGLLAYPLQTFRDLRVSLRGVRENRVPDYEGLVRQIENLARLRRVSGPRELADAGEQLNNAFLRRGIELVADGYGRTEILSIMEKEFEFYLSGRETQVSLLNTLARFAPSFGFVGTIIGLINILQQMSDPSLLGPGMAMALLTTLYGLLFANLCFLPLAKKLAEQLRREAMFLNIILEGLLDIAASKNPISIGHRLRSSVHPQRDGAVPARSSAPGSLRRRHV